MTGGVVRQALIVLRKEVIDSFRDRRALVSIVFGANTLALWHLLD